MSTFEERVREEAERLYSRHPVNDPWGQRASAYIAGATFARTVTREEVEAAARAYLEAGPADARWLLTMEHIRESVRARVRAAFRAAGFDVQP